MPGRRVDEGAVVARAAEVIGALDGIRNDLLGQEGQGINLFTDNYYLKPYMAAHRRLVLWADLTAARTAAAVQDAWKQKLGLIAILRGATAQELAEAVNRGEYIVALTTLTADRGDASGNGDQCGRAAEPARCGTGGGQ